MLTTVYQGQSLLDKALEIDNNLNNLLEMAFLNNISITDNLSIGSQIVVNKSIKNFDKKRTATAINVFEQEQMPIIGIGTMIISNNFIVQ